MYVYCVVFCVYACVNVVEIVCTGLGHFHTDCTLWGRLVFGKIQERLGSGLGLGVRGNQGSKFPLAMF